MTGIRWLDHPIHLAYESSRAMGLVIAYLTQGKIRIKDGAHAPRTLDSPYANSIQERSLRAQQRNSWKSQGAGLFGGSSLWGARASEGLELVSATSLTRGATPRQVVYSLTSGTLCALMSAENLGAEERRLWNNNNHHLQFIHACPRTGNLAFSVLHQNATANIGVMLKDEPGFSEITEGDSVDTAPSWVPGEEKRLVFQSAGVGRTREGHFSTLGPFGIQTVNIETSEMETLLENPRFDHLAPRLAETGALYYIRRPYNERQQIQPLRVIKDFFLLPFRLLFAIFQFFSFFTEAFTGKKLTTSGGPSRNLDVKRMIIWGNVVAAQRSREEDETPDLVPSSWQLVRRIKGDEEVLAKGVLAYDLAADGTVVYTNGSAVFSRRPDGRVERVLAEGMIEQVVLLET